MTVPRIVQERLGDEEIRARIPLGGEDQLVITPSRSFLYRGEGLLSNESIEEYSHDAERLHVSRGRRKSKIGLEHGIDGSDELPVPTKQLDESLKAVFAGVLLTAGVIEPDEQIERIYQLGELTLAITSARLIKYVGAAVWDEEDYEAFHYDDVTDIEVEQGEVSSQIIIEVDGRPQRIKTPSGDTREIREYIERSVYAHHDVGSYAEFRDLVAPAEDDEDDDESEVEVESETETEAESSTGAEEDEGSTQTPEFEEEFDLIGATEETTGTEPQHAEAPGGGDSSDTESAVATEVSPDEAGSAEFESAGFEPAHAQTDNTTEQLASLKEAVERQNELLTEQQRTIEQLIEELRRGR